MLAPVLARLDEIPGVAAARVESSGRFFCVALAEEALQSAAPLVLAALGAGARALSEGEARAQLSGRQRGDPWLAADEVMTLSFVESRLLSVRLAAAFARETGAGAEAREAVAEAIRGVLFEAMERVHAEGGRQSGGWIYREWPALSAAVVERCGSSLDSDLRLRLAALLPSLLAR